MVTRGCRTRRQILPIFHSPDKYQFQIGISARAQNIHSKWSIRWHHPHNGRLFTHYMTMGSKWKSSSSGSEPRRPVLAFESRFLSYSWFNVCNNSILVPFRMIFPCHQVHIRIDLRIIITRPGTTEEQEDRTRNTFVFAELLSLDDMIRFGEGSSHSS